MFVDADRGGGTEALLGGEAVMTAFERISLWRRP